MATFKFWWRWWRKQSTSQKAKFLALVGGLALFVLLALGSVVTLALIQTLPSDEEIGSREVVQSTKIYDRTGEILLYEIHGEEKRTVISFSEIPEHLKQATIALEDQNFYSHPAFDWRGIARAVFADILHFEKRQGGSTITQQLAKRLFYQMKKHLSAKPRNCFWRFASKNAIPRMKF